MPQTLNKSYLTPHEVAALLMVSPITVRGWANKGLLKAETTPGGHRRFLLSEVDRFIQERPLLSRSLGLRVLIVDDEVALAKSLAIYLSGLGVSTEVAFDGFDAGKKLNAFDPDIILLDLMMPGLDGFDVCRRIKQNPAHNKLRIIAMTGYPSPENEQLILECGAERLLVKPVDAKQLAIILGIPSE
jgi:excisionase family DNA binding protein